MWKILHSLFIRIRLYLKQLQWQRKFSKERLRICICRRRKKRKWRNFGLTQLPSPKTEKRFGREDHSSSHTPSPPISDSFTFQTHSSIFSAFAKITKERERWIQEKKKNSTKD